MKIYDLLNKLNIKYDEVSHKAVFTHEEAHNAKIAEMIEGLECKNLFLKCKNQYFLVFIIATKKAPLKELAKLVNVSHLSFASEEELKDILGLNLGSVTPLGIINDTNLLVKLVIDKDVIGHKLLMHSDTNTKTLSITYDDLIRYIESTNHEYILF